MKGKLLRGINGSVQPRRLLHGYQDAVFAWSGENPFANLAQSDLYRILPRTQYSDNWLKSTPYGKAFRANYYADSGHGYVFSRHVPDANQTYAKGVTGYAEFVYSANLQTGEYIQHLCCISSSADGNTNETYYGVLTFGLENFSGKGLCPTFRVGNNVRLYGFAGGWGEGDGGTLVPVSIPVGALVRQMVSFNPDTKVYASILTFNDVVYEASGTVPNGFASTGSSILVGGYPRGGARAAYVSGMLDAAIWNRAMAPAEMRVLLQRPSIFQPAELIFPFSFGESPAGSEVINTTPEAIVLSPIQAELRTTEILNTQAGSLSLTPAAASIHERVVIDCLSGALSISSTPCAIYQQQAIGCVAADTVVSGEQASIVGAGQDVIGCAAASVSLAAAAAQLEEIGSSTINCTTGALSVIAPAASMVEAGDSLIGCSAAALSVSASSASQIEAGDSTINCAAGVLSVASSSAGIVEVGNSVISCSTAALTLTAPAAQQIESGDSVIGCVSASLTLTTAAAQQVEVGDSVIGCAATIVSLDGTTATITDSMGARSAAVVLSTPGCSIHDFDIIGAGQAALVTGSSAAALVESGKEIIYTGYADIGISAAQCGIVQTDAEPIITNIGLVASINQPTITASIPNITIIARV